jgi:hypothetical protein
METAKYPYDSSSYPGNVRVSYIKRFVDLNDHTYLILVMGLAAFHLILEAPEEKNNMHKGTHLGARPVFSTAFSVTWIKDRNQIQNA